MITKISFLAFLASIVHASEPSLLRHYSASRSLQAPEDCDTCYNETAGDGTVYYLYPQWLNNSRNYVYCEMLWDYGSPHGTDLYSTSPIAPCNTTWWDNLNLTDVANLLNATSSSKNGPQSWTMDSVRVYASDPVDILGEPMVFGALFAPGGTSTPQYEGEKRLVESCPSCRVFPTTKIILTISYTAASFSLIKTKSFIHPRTSISFGTLTNQPIS